MQNRDVINQQLTGEYSASGWLLWIHQMLAILRLEVKKNFLSRRATLIYLLAAAPVLLWAALVTFDSGARRDFSQNFGEAQSIFANFIYEGLILRTAVFFGCAWTFMNLFRGEMVDKSLHYYFLSPVRREVLVAGKYFSGLVTSIFLFGSSTVGALFFLYLARGYPANVDYLVNGPGLKHSLTYLAMTVLACIGYGAMFMVIGLFFRNLIVTLLLALLFYGLEWVNFLLPPLLKKLSIIHYIHSLAPVPIDEGPLAIIGEPTPWWVAVPGMLIITALVLIAAGTRIRRMEVHYGNE
jgi:ABC-type transport system involved in multi-copper enzyme maturation permease subunit